MDEPTAAGVIFFLLKCVKHLLLSLTPLLRYDTHTHTHAHTHTHTHTHTNTHTQTHTKCKGKIHSCRLRGHAAWLQKPVFPVRYAGSLGPR